jgi:hypothetical protein
VKPPLILLTLALALLAAGCGGGTVIDHTAAEEDIRAGFALRDITVKAVECPSDVDTGEGEPYECEAQTSEGEFRIIYRQLDADGNVSQPRIERIPE